jgi:hypothetical protein
MTLRVKFRIRRCILLSIHPPVLLSSRDGFLLLQNFDLSDLCLCNPVTGDCTFLPGVRFAAAGHLRPGHQLRSGPVRRPRGSGSRSEGGGDQRGDPHRPQPALLSHPWPVRFSPKLKMHVHGDYVVDLGTEVVCRGAIHWLGESTAMGTRHLSILAIDARSGRT